MCAGVVALGGGTLATTADASTTKVPGHTQSSQQAAKPKHCRLVVGDPYKSGSRHLKANARYYCKKRANLVMRMHLTDKAQRSYRAGHSWRMNRTIGTGKGKGCTKYQLRVKAVAYKDDGGYYDLVATGHSHWKTICG
ncbi:hypothetical protein AN218_27320 [Streptomyces nanshensis]|uniref:Uncharacterized protein n=1 Tax=Streptomyces nanshensis TaxID=518642 RepID=A0A1E7KWF8_9ACTN|nr:hypothetical protein AN218_27320 [Streptomyces nanshensis]